MLRLFLQAALWRQADQETHRLMITTVGKRVGSYFEKEDLETFPREVLKTLNQLWVKYSKGKWGFSVQKKIWQECDRPMSYSENWKKFYERIGWIKNGQLLSYNDLNFNLNKSVPGEFPGYGLPTASEPWSYLYPYLFSRIEP